MSNLPLPARILLCAVCAAGGVGFFAAFFGIEWPESMRLETLWRRDAALELVLFGALGILSGSKKVVLLRLKQGSDVGSMSLSFVVIYAALLRLGPPAGVLVGILSTLSSCTYPNRFPLYQTLFNVAVDIIQTLCAGWVFLKVNEGPLQAGGGLFLPAIVASTLVFFLINTGLVAAIITLADPDRKRTLWGVWQETFLWTAPSYFLGAGFGYVAIALLRDHLLALLFCALPVVYLTHASYKSYMARAEALLESRERLADLYLATIRSLALAIDAKDQYTHQHILRVQQYAVATARQMGVTGDELVGIETAALLHDIGKLGVPEYVLRKPGRLTDEEFAKIKEHPRIGADILDPVPFPWPVLPGVKHHHERWDGTGYPDGLKGEDIPLQGRILAVADVYDALTSSRSYRNAWTHERAVAEIREKSGTHFDPRVAEAFLQVIDGVVEEMAREGIGPLVRTESGAAVGEPALPPTRADEAARDIQRAASELWALYEVAETLSSSLGLEETLEILGRKITAILPGTSCAFLLAENGDGAVAELTVRVTVGLNREYLAGVKTAPVGSRSREVLRNRETYCGPYDPEDLNVGGGAPPAVPWIQLKSALIVPIIHQGRSLGTINLYHTHEGAFGPHDQQLLELIGQRAALAIYNGLLFDRTRSHALTDPLTGLANVRFLMDYLEKRCTPPSDPDVPLRPFSLLCIDLDSFKPINDNFGHQSGDRVLCSLARLFQQALRPCDVVARYGGDEFLVVVEGAEEGEALAVAQRLREAVSGYEAGLFHHRLGAVRLGASIGIACYPQDGNDAASLISRADARMYDEKAERKLMRLIEAEAAVGASGEGGGAVPARDEFAVGRLPATDSFPQVERRRRGGGGGSPPIVAALLERRQGPSASDS
jgi:diguanylate cyclase (GGDEF) domain/uncharacterized domain HDIG